MNIKINNSANRPKLAKDMVEVWDLEDLVYYAESKMEDFLYDLSDEDFTKQWEEFYDKQKSNGESA